MGQPSPQPFQLHLADETLRDLRERLMRVRWPDEPPGAPWSTGSSVDYVRELVGYWREGFDWRAQETALNRFRHFKVPLGGIDLHFIQEEGRARTRCRCYCRTAGRVRSSSSIRSFPCSRTPRVLAGIPGISFTVVAPSLPGYTLSFAPGQVRFGVEGISDLFAELMTDVLGYGRFAAQGGDWGAFYNLAAWATSFQNASLAST